MPRIRRKPILGKRRGRRKRVRLRCGNGTGRRNRKRKEERGTWKETEMRREAKTERRHPKASGQLEALLRILSSI